MLNENRAWDDNGTGHVSVTYSEKPKFMMLDVKSEVDGETSICLVTFQTLLKVVFQPAAFGVGLLTSNWKA